MKAADTLLEKRERALLVATAASPKCRRLPLSSTCIYKQFRLCDSLHAGANSVC